MVWLGAGYMEIDLYNKLAAVEVVYCAENLRSIPQSRKYRHVLYPRPTRFHRSDAEAYLVVIKRLIPQIAFAIVFDPPAPDPQIRNVREEKSAEPASMID